MGINMVLMGIIRESVSIKIGHYLGITWALLGISTRY